MNEMTDEQINQAVAECCGWKVIPSPLFPDELQWLLDPKGEKQQSRGEITEDDWLEHAPYISSRDAMAGALEKLSEEEWRRFIDLLWVEIGSPALKEADNLNKIAVDFCLMIKALLLATPLQACRAFLKAKGKL